MKQILKGLKPYTAMVVLSVVLVMGSVGSMLYLPSYMADIINEGVLGGDMSLILEIGLKMLIITLLGSAAMVGSSYFSAKASMGLGRDLRRDIFYKVENFSLSEMDKFGTASLITRTTNDITQIENVLFMSLRMAVMAPIALVGGVIMAFSTSVEMSKVIFLTVPALLILVGIVAGITIPLSKKIQKLIDNLNRILREKLSGVRVLRAFGTEEYEEKRFDEANEELTSVSLRMNRIMAVIMPALMFILNFSTVGIVWLGMGEVMAGGIEVGNIMEVVQYVMYIMFSFVMMSMMFVMIPRAAASADRIAQVLNTQNSVVSPATPVTTGEQKGYVKFEDVTFFYGNSEAPALKNISFEVAPGKTLAIIGSTGSGKTTILNLIPRFYDVSDGRVLIDGVDVRRQDMQALRQKIGYVTQKAVLFSGDITHNIAYGAQDATQQRISLAANIAQAEQFISGKEDGYKSEVNQGGTNFSGGQKQRLSIARAIARQPEIYLFDDSFSALDYQTDSKLRSALAGHTADAAVIIVAQRVSTIMNADQILVLSDDGGMAGLGTHSDLLKDCEIYREIVTSQFSKEEVS